MKISGEQDETYPLDISRHIVRPAVSGKPDPAITPNLRKYFSELDYAAMNDIGWEASPIPEMEIRAMMLAGLGLLGWSSATRRRG